MRKFWLCCASILILVGLCVTSYASSLETSSDLENDANTGSGENSIDSGDNSVYINSFEEYQKLLDLEEKTRNEYVYGYLDSLRAARDTSGDYAVEYKARVVWASDAKTEYGQDSYTGTYYKNTFQNVRVKMLEGPFADEDISGEALGESGDMGLIDGVYTLTCDLYENIILPEVKVGDVILVGVYETDAGIRAYSGSYDSPKVRIGSTVFVLIVTIVFMLIYAGKHGFKMLIPFVLIFDLIIVVAAPAICEGFSSLILVAFITLLTSILVPVLKFGVNEKSISVALSTSVVMVIMTIVVSLFNAIVGNSGITFEANYLKDYVIPIVSNDLIYHLVNFESLSICVTMLTILFAVLYVACKTIEIYEKSSNKDKVEYVSEAIKEVLGNAYLLVGGILFVQLLPKFMLFILSECTLTSILNSEMLSYEICKILFVFIAMSVTSMITTTIRKFLDE